MDVLEHNRQSVKRYQQRNPPEGKCKRCPEPLDRNSTQHCTRHLEHPRETQREKSKKLGRRAPGKHPNTLAVEQLRKDREEIV